MKALIASITAALIVGGTAYPLSPVSFIERFYGLLSKLDIPVSMYEFIDPDDFMKKVDAASYTLSENEFTDSVFYFWAKNDIFRAIPVDATLRGLLKKLYFAKSVFTPGNLVDIYKMDFIPPIMKKIRVNTSLTNDEEKLLWKIFALKYPEWNNRPVYSMEVEWIQYAFEKAFNRIGGRLDILELGCGSMGNLLSRFKADHRESVDAAVGIDMNISLDELDQSINGIVLQEQDMTDGIDWPDYSFDIIYENYVFMYFSDEELSRVLGEIWRLLKPGGFLLTKKDLSSEKLLKKQGLTIRYVEDYLLQKTIFFPREEILSTAA